MDKTLFEELVYTCVVTRDFCGDETRSITDLALEMGVDITPEVIFDVRVRATEIYDKIKKEIKISNEKKD